MCGSVLFVLCSQPDGAVPDIKPTTPTLCNDANQGSCTCGCGDAKTYVFWPALGNGEPAVQRCVQAYNVPSAYVMPIIESEGSSPVTSAEPVEPPYSAAHPAGAPTGTFKTVVTYATGSTREMRTFNYADGSTKVTVAYTDGSSTDIVTNVDGSMTVTATSAGGVIQSEPYQLTSQPVVMMSDGDGTDGPYSGSGGDEQAAKYYGFTLIRMAASTDKGATGFRLEFPSNGIINAARENNNNNN